MLGLLFNLEEGGSTHVLSPDHDYQTTRHSREGKIFHDYHSGKLKPHEVEVSQIYHIKSLKSIRMQHLEAFKKALIFQ
jgi:hypothetical protein